MKPTSQSDFKRFDMLKGPVRQRFFLKPLTWLLSYPDVWKHRSKVVRVGMEGLKPPYLLLCNHNAFLDFKVMTTALFPHGSSVVVAIDGFIGREWLLRNTGCICKRKFTNDPALVRHLRTVAKRGDIVVLYPEARYSLCGTNAILPQSLGKLAKLLRLPVVTLIMHGHHINSPYWNLEQRGNRTEATLKQLISADEIRSLSHEEINRLINEDFVYDEYAWQKANRIRVTCKNRAKGLHKVLYQCPHCRTEYRMESDGDQLRCGACRKIWTMSEYGELAAAGGEETEFAHIPDWYEWERAQVRQEVEEGRYHFNAPVTVRSLPNADGFILLGDGVLTHDGQGFNLTGEYNGQPYQVLKSVSSQYSCHIEYDYLGKFGDCVDLNTLTDTYYIYPKDCDFAVTKIALATEELHARDRRMNAGRE